MDDVLEFLLVVLIFCWICGIGPCQRVNPDPKLSDPIAQRIHEIEQSATLSHGDEAKLIEQALAATNTINSVTNTEVKVEK